MDRLGMVEYLGRRYDDEVARFPLLARVSRERYIRVNVAYMVRSDYWRARGAA